MGKGKEKNWTILFYLNGKNELQPEMFESKKIIEKECGNSSVTVLVQHGGIEKHTVKILRPCNTYISIEDANTSVERYSSSGFFFRLEDILGNVNMADPRCLYDFIEWGMTSYPAKHYMLVVGGHVFQYVGLMPDYSQTKPYLMGYPEMVNALTLIQKNLGQKIDILVLDTCYMNRIEMLYELGKAEDPPVLHALTYISDGPMSGLPYHMLIRIIKAYRQFPLLLLIQKMVANLPYDLIAYNINHQKLEDIKSAYHELASSFLDSQYGSSSDPSELLTTIDEKLPWYPALKNLFSKMPSLTIEYKNSLNSKFRHFYISIQKSEDPYKISLYNRLAFARNNAWTTMLYGFPARLPPVDDTNPDLEPFILSPNELYSFISVMNPDLSYEQNSRIVQMLIAHRVWK